MFSGTSKTPLKDKENIKFRPIIDQTGTYTYNAAQMISDCLKPLCKNEHTINNTQSFSQKFSTIPPFGKDEEDVSYDVKPLFPNIAVKETIDYIIDQIYLQKKLTPIRTKIVFERLFRSAFTNKLMDIQWVAHSVTFGDIYVIKLENEIAASLKPVLLEIF